MRKFVFEEEDDGMTEMASAMTAVTASDWEENINANVSTEFDVTPCVDQHSRPSSDVTFYNSVIMKGDISKLSASIGSCNVYFEP